MKHADAMSDIWTLARTKSHHRRDDGRVFISKDCSKNWAENFVQMCQEPGKHFFSLIRGEKQPSREESLRGINESDRVGRPAQWISDCCTVKKNDVSKQSQILSFFGGDCQNRSAFHFTVNWDLV
jgi:hypothetical protein